MRQVPREAKKTGYARSRLLTEYRWRSSEWMRIDWRELAKIVVMRAVDHMLEVLLEARYRWRQGGGGQLQDSAAHSPWLGEHLWVFDNDVELNAVTDAPQSLDDVQLRAVDGAVVGQPRVVIEADRIDD